MLQHTAITAPQPSYGKVEALSAAVVEEDGGEAE